MQRERERERGRTTISSFQTLSVDPCRSVDAGASLDDAISVDGRGGLGRLAKGDMEVARSFAMEMTEGRAWLGLGLGLG